MPLRWTTWKAELESVSAFAEEWREGLVEEFVRGVEEIAARKRNQRQAIEKLSGELMALHATYRQLLAFFDLERASSGWSAANCPAEDVDLVLGVLEEWREHLLNYSGMFPPSDADIRSLAALQDCIREAQCAADVIRGGFGVLDEWLGPRDMSAADEQAVEQPAPSPESLPAETAATEAAEPVAPEAEHAAAAAPGSAE